VKAALWRRHPELALPGAVILMPIAGYQRKRGWFSSRRNSRPAHAGGDSREGEAAPIGFRRPRKKAICWSPANADI